MFLLTKSCFPNRAKVDKIHYDLLSPTILSTLNTNSKIGVLSDSAEFEELSRKYKGRYKFKFLQEKLYSTYVGLEQAPYYFFSESFNSQIPALIEGGLFHFWMSSHKNSFDKQRKPGPEVLTMNHLMFGFKLWLLILFMALISFAFELCVSFKNYFIRIFIIQILLRTTAER